MQCPRLLPVTEVNAIVGFATCSPLVNHAGRHCAYTHYPRWVATALHAICQSLVHMLFSLAGR